MRILLAGLLGAMLTIPTLPAAGLSQTDEQVRQALIQQSIASYPGNCPCPYNTAANGSRCGKRSAYSKPGGHAPLCFPQDVTDKMVEDYRRANGAKPK
ncbi:hypothetical protein [Niveispirillum fermenti]|uniref:hypothetical protein n=1 Tax=Niveispirillum fermenti TaxID=1233113 RepID=UPI003A89EAEF